MSILHDIQQSIIGAQNIAPILLKLRLLAAKLGSEKLESWIQYESEGYPSNVDVPSYRKIPVSFIADFAGAFGRRIKNAPIPNHLVEKIAGERWTKNQYRKSISELEDLISNTKDTVYINASDLILQLQGNFYPDYTCMSVEGIISVSPLIGIQNSVRCRILEFTIQLEKSIPAVASIGFEQNKNSGIFNNKQQVSQIADQTIFNQNIQGNLTVINSKGRNVNINVTVEKEDKPSLVNYLVSQNFPKDSAKAFADIVASERPKGKNIPFGEKASKWIRDNLPRLSEICKMTYSTILKLIEKAVLNYYGL